MSLCDSACWQTAAVTTTTTKATTTITTKSVAWEGVWRKGHMISDLRLRKKKKRDDGLLLLLSPPYACGLNCLIYTRESQNARTPTVTNNRLTAQNDNTHNESLHLDRMARSWLWAPCTDMPMPVALPELRALSWALEVRMTAKCPCHRHSKRGQIHRPAVTPHSWPAPTSKHWSCVFRCTAARLVCRPWACLDTERTKTCLWLARTLNYTLLWNSKWILKCLEDLFQNS